MKHVSHIQI